MSERASWFVRLRNRRNGVRFAYWIGGVVLAIFVAGVSANAYMGNFETRARAADYRGEHRRDHKDVNGRVRDVDDDVHKVQIIQARIDERGQLMDLRLEWMQERLEKTENHRDRREQENRVERIERMIERQEKLVKRLEDR